MSCRFVMCTCINYLLSSSSRTSKHVLIGCYARENLKKLRTFRKAEVKLDVMLET